MIVYRNPVVHALSIAYNRICNAQNRRLNHPDLFKRHVWRAEDAIKARIDADATTNRQWELIRRMIEFTQWGKGQPWMQPTERLDCTHEEWQQLVALFEVEPLDH